MRCVFYAYAYACWLGISFACVLCGSFTFRAFERETRYRFGQMTANKSRLLRPIYLYIAICDFSSFNVCEFIGNMRENAELVSAFRCRMVQYIVYLVMMVYSRTDRKIKYTCVVTTNPEFK